MKKRNLKKPMISALEQRILFDGAAVATAVDVLDESSFSSNNTQTTTTSNDVTQNNAENSVHEAQAVQGFERDRREVAFVDVTVSDYQTLVDGVGVGVEVYLVSSLDDINSILKSETNIDAIHILSHGNVGEISVGNDVLNQNTLNNFDTVLQTMKNSLSENGDILLYGCNVASDGTGQEFIDTLASITDADVAASDDVTGNSALGGDWNLEVISGVIETHDLNIISYDGILASTTFNFSSGTIDLNYTNHIRQNIGGVVVDATILDAGTSPIVSSGIFTDSSNQGKTMQFNFSTPSVASSIKVGYYSNTGMVGDFSVKGYDGASQLYSYTISSPNASTPYTLDLATLGWSSNLTKIEVNNTGAGKVTFFADDIVIAPSNPAPTDIQLSSTLAPQDLTGAVIANIRALDKNGLVSSMGDYNNSYAYIYFTDTITFSEVTDSSNLFNVSSSGVLSLDSGKSLANGVSADITIRATDTNGNYYDETFTITGGAYNTITVAPNGTNTFTYNGSTINNTYTNTNWTTNDDSFYIVAPSASGADLNDPEQWVTLSSALTYDPLNNGQDVEYVAGSNSGTDTFILGNQYYVVTVGSVVDTTPPTFDVTPSASNVSSTTLDLSASLNEAGTIYYVVVANGATAPSVAQVLAGQDSSGATALKSGNSDVTTSPFDGTFNITGLSANTAYDIYVVAQDDEGTPNVMASAIKVDVTTATNKTITINEDTPTVLSVSDFGFSDVDTGDTLSNVKITSLASDGVLEYNNGTSWVAVTLDQVITNADITGNKLRFNPSLNENGTSYSTFQFTVNDGTIDSVSSNTITYDVTAVNDAPTAIDKTITINEDTPTLLSVSDFGFSDVDTTDTLTSVKITSLSTHGMLEYNNGTSWVAVSLNQVITATDITDGKLRFNPALNENGTAYATFDFTVNDGTTDSVNANTITYNVTAVNDAPEGTVTISGTVTQGEILTASNNITDADGMGTVSYQWFANGVEISGATGSTYTLTQNEVNKAITVVASYTDGFGANESVTSSATTSVVNVNDA
ncbi:MAG: DUF4347 domain-containing protein, partial [Arcobacter sp.]|uniref:DUF4347 domain-containing protein n=1 Tax=Arcobacter sp. TaxID=1872629 RepID=UPI002A75B240